MKVVGYTRRSTGKQDMSLDDQRSRIESFCETEDEYQFGEEHTLVEIFQEEVSGSTYPFGEKRDAFPDLVDRLNDDPSIEGIVVWEFDRLARDSIRQVNVKDKLRRYHVGRDIEVMQIDPWMPPYRAIPPVFPDELKNQDEPMVAYNLRQVFMLQGNSALWEMLMTAKRTKEGMAEKKRAGDPIGRQPRGITTDKQREDMESDQSTMRLPKLDDVGEVVDNFVMAVDVLNTLATTEKSPYQVGTDYGISSPDRAVKTMWENREKYREAAVNDPHNDWPIEF